jgi:RimJ/RimL family protein N-acetyltransferase
VQGTLHEERLSSANVRAVLEYLAASPYENVFLAYLVTEAPPAMKRDLHAIFDERRVVAVGYFGRQVALASEPAAIPFLAEIATARDERAIVGPSASVSSYWNLVAARHRPPRLVRSRQPVMAIAAPALRPAHTPLRVRPARDGEWREVAGNSAAMIAAELETDPREDPDFDSTIRRMIRLRLWWVGELDDRLSFFCNIGAWSPYTAQLQGIWTPPDLRNRGIAGSALSGICRELLQVFPTLSLYVNDFNLPAIRLYRRLGFADAGELQTILF